ncbi:conserved hypothetical protein [Aspergillus terreus NIH2624]|uniref:SH3 domain-containing protein n=1 Tax=Aspergillus terreus (strain NIH 2624 / FGSC A1156) TaxID=341663 RepID=Q0CD73_ASPTN|nr:uncharacterized protein ATEG_08361 [Aspergillus terreus NIH2624]EAU31534.1 conserved hypothetical protein [Aspergillus terreus NIH2624]
MQSVQRQFGRFMKRSADDSQVAILLKDFDDADKLLGKIIESTSAWRDAWSSLLSHQSRMLGEFEGLYAPIVGSADTSTSHTPVETPEATIVRTNKLHDEYEELRKDLMEELAAVDQRMIQPASQAKEFMSPLKKTIKKRDDRKLDYERYQGRVDSYAKKTKRSDRDNVALSKAESDLAKATEEYQAADEHLRQILPPLIAAVFSLLPRLLAAQIEIQNTMLGHYYTVILNYSEQERFPSPSPPMEQIVEQWEQDFLSVQQEIESFGCLANGKTVRMGHGTDDHRTGGITNGRLPNLPNGLNFHRRPSGQSSTQPQQASAPAARKASQPSPPLDTKPSPVYETKPRPTGLASSAASNLTVPSTYATPSSPNDSYTPAAAASRTDYFSRSPSHPSSGSGSVSPGHSVLAAVAGKKKPPPPPPPRAGSSNALFVTALYDFGGESPGDLAFREGDRIRVLKKTESTDEWWEGELRGVKGSFPANYVE